MHAREATRLGRDIAAHVQAGQTRRALALLAPVLAQRTPFPVLGAIGEAIGAGPAESVIPFLQQISADRSMGGWVVAERACSPTAGRDRLWRLAGAGGDALQAVAEDAGSHPRRGLSPARREALAAPSARSRVLKG